MPWHRITLDGMAAPGETRIYHYMDQYIYPEKWLYKQDAARFLADGSMVFPPPSDNVVSIGEGLGGQLWTHARTDVGATNDLGTGLHGTGLANHYMEIDPEWLYYKSPIGPIVADSPSFMELFTPKGDPAPWRELVEGPIFEAAGRSVLVETEKGFGLLDASGMVQDLSSYLSAGAQRFMSGGVRNVGAIDQPLGKEPAAMVLSEDGTQVVGALFRTADGLTSSEDPDGIQIGLIGAKLPTAAKEAVLVYSPRLRSLYAFDTRSGAVHRGDLELGTVVPLADGPTGVRAVTADAGQSVLYLLDSDGRQTHFRMLNAFTGELRTLATIASSLPEDTGAFLRMIDGKVLVALSSQSDRKFTVLAFEPGIDASPQLLFQGEGSLILPPLQSKDGFVLTTGLEGRVQVFEAPVRKPLGSLRTWEDLALYY
jgi:hypothetical protein